MSPDIHPEAPKRGALSAGNKRNCTTGNKQTKPTTLAKHAEGFLEKLSMLLLHLLGYGCLKQKLKGSSESQLDGVLPVQTLTKELLAEADTDESMFFY